MIVIKQSGSFRKTRKFIERASRFTIKRILNSYGEAGVKALAEATPKDTGNTSEKWYYEILIDDRGASIRWLNSNINDGVNIAIILRYGHGTGTGGYVEGRDYISPAILPIFDKMADSAWEEVVG